MTVEVTDHRIDLRMSPRDLINIGVFGALYIVTVGLFNLLEFISPVMTLVTSGLSIVAAGVPFMLFLTRVRHAGMVTVLAVIVTGFMLLIGSPPVTLLVGVLGALIAEALLYMGRYRSRQLSVLAYAAFSTWFVGLFLPVSSPRSPAPTERARPPSPVPRPGSSATPARCSSTAARCPAHGAGARRRSSCRTSSGSSSPTASPPNCGSAPSRSRRATPPPCSPISTWTASTNVTHCRCPAASSSAWSSPRPAAAGAASSSSTSPAPASTAAIGNPLARTMRDVAEGGAVVLLISHDGDLLALAGGPGTAPAPDPVAAAEIGASQ
ncbi:hypothetical protein SGLAM104S_04221 [Streptomyces glaucescens]